MSGFESSAFSLCTQFTAPVHFSESPITAAILFLVLQRVEGLLTDNHAYMYTLAEICTLVRITRQ